MTSEAQLRLQLGHNLLIVDRIEQSDAVCDIFPPSIGPQSFDCGQAVFQDNVYIRCPPSIGPQSFDCGQAKNGHHMLGVLRPSIGPQSFDCGQEKA